MDELRNKIISLVEHYASDQLDFVIDLCNQNSYSYNKAGVDRVSAMIIDRLAGILPLYETRKQKELGDHHILRNSRSGAGKGIYLVGHADTVFPPDHPFQECRLQDDQLIGPGTGDMKGGLAVLVYALKVLKDVDLLDRLRLVLLLNSDEELGSASSRSIFLEERERAALCLAAECAGLHNEIVVSRNGKMGARVKSFGRGRHVSLGAENKSSAILEISHKIIALEGLNGSLPGVDINVGTVAGGLGPGTVPEQAACMLDIRWQDEAHKAVLQAKIEAVIAASSQPGCHSEFEIMNWRPAMPDNPGTRKLIEMIRQISRCLDQEIGTEHRRGTSDANFFGAVGVPSLDGWGPIAGNDHTAEEFMKISSLKERTALLTLFLLEYGRKENMISFTP